MSMHPSGHCQGHPPGTRSTGHDIPPEDREHTDGIYQRPVLKGDAEARP